MTKEIKRIKIRMNKKEAQMKRIKRFSAVLMCVACTIGIVTGITTISAHENYETRIITVERGDSLWGLVSEHYSDDCNIRKIISKVKKINNIKGSHLQIGERIIIPIYS